MGLWLRFSFENRGPTQKKATPSGVRSESKCFQNFKTENPCFRNPKMIIHVFRLQNSVFEPRSRGLPSSPWFWALLTMFFGPGEPGAESELSSAFAPQGVPCNFGARSESTGDRVFPWSMFGPKLGFCELQKLKKDLGAIQLFVFLPRVNM